MPPSTAPPAVPRTITIGLVQMACRASRQQNLERALDGIAAAASRGAQVVCLQELFTSLYPAQAEAHDRFAEAESIPGPTSAALAKQARRWEVVVVASLFERRAAGVYHNTAIVLDADGSLAGRYRKMHIPDDPGYYEKFYFTPGDLGFASIATRYGRVGVCICWDQWFPEAARLTALRGAELLLYPTAIAWLAEERETVGPSQLRAWETMLRSHAIANGLFVAASNRVGAEGQLQFWGRSLVVDPYGNVLGQASQVEEETLVRECDLSLIETARTHWPFFRDRRIDAYADLTQRWIDGVE